MSLSEIECATFRLVAQCLNKLRYHVFPLTFLVSTDDRLAEELERICEGAAVVRSRRYPNFFLQWLRKTMKTYIQVEIPP
jgi:hypothetical protein